MTTAAITALPRVGARQLSLRERLGRAQAHGEEGASRDVANLLDRITALLGDQLAGAEARERVAAARARALAIAPSGGPEVAAVSFLSDLFVSSAVEREWSPAQTTLLFDAVADLARVSTSFLRTSVCLRAVRDPALLELPAELAIETVLNVLLALAPVKDASVWRRGEESRVECLASAGAGAPTVQLREVAVAALTPARGGRADGPASIRAVPVLCWQRPDAVLVVRARRGETAQASALAEEAATLVGVVLEREMILERNAARERSLVEASERRLTRLAFDLHDGPIQDVVALAAEVRLLRQELVDRSEPSGARDGAGVRFDELEAHLLEVGRELREVSSSLTPTRALRSVRDGLANQIESFRKQADIEATLEVTGDFEPLTASQRIAILRIVQEALANVREHSGATRARVAASVAGGFVRVEVSDDGRGFDVDGALPKAAKDGRLGLVGMSERVRLLGGRMDVDSRPGGPTTISAVLRVWQPLATASREQSFVVAAGA
jgi:signal transduction histidine kinase